MTDPIALVMAATGRDRDDAIDALKERAAIREHLGRFSREDANRLAIGDAIDMLGGRRP